jgi:hypothetical protein
MVSITPETQNHAQAMACSLDTLSADSPKPLNCFNLQQMSEADSIGDRSGKNSAVSG